MSTHVASMLHGVQPGAPRHIYLPERFSVGDLRQLIDTTVAGYSHPRISVRLLNVTYGRRVYLGWETCQSGLNMRITPPHETNHFDIAGTYAELFVKPISLAEPEKRSCSHHGIPDGAISELRNDFLTHLVRATYSIKCA